MAYENIILENDGKVSLITINRPQSLNALNAKTISELSGVLDEITLMRCVNLAHNLGMSAIVETHSSMQVKKALRVGAKIIGVNNRDLRDFSVDLNTTLKLRDNGSISW